MKNKDKNAAVAQRAAAASSSATANRTQNTPFADAKELRKLKRLQEELRFNLPKSKDDQIEQLKNRCAFYQMLALIDEETLVEQYNIDNKADFVQNISGQFYQLDEANRILNESEKGGSHE